MAERVIQCIVEGEGDVASMRVLLPRIDPELTVLRPIRVKRQKVLKHGELERCVQLAARHLVARRAASDGVILVLLDADDDLPCVLAPALLQRVRAERGDVVTRVVLARREFEAWFLAALDSLRGKRGIPPDAQAPAEPETVSDCKGRLSELMGRRYEPPTDQPRFSHLFDIQLARLGAPSFDKLLRDLETPDAREPSSC